MPPKAKPLDSTPKKKSVSKSAKCGLTFPVARINRKLKASGMKRVGGGAPVYLTAVAEYIVSEVIELSGNLCKDRKRKTISVDDVSSAVRSDPELARLFAGFNVCFGNTFSKVSDALAPRSVKPEKSKD